MKLLHSALLAFTLGLAAATGAQARDSFSVTINAGGHGHHAYPVATHYVVPVHHPAAYYQPHRVHYAPVHVQTYRYAPKHNFRAQRHYQHHYHQHQQRHGRHH
ncbi:MAG: hypothetical protein CVU29_00040 [Betaproteobacteria bacterium HGW-Betaproteobacteria-22]|nr:MAG: hypothetical protein CVU29_00040 [Betaproteobacteria bacterium HGW-Betaproteobacteria-22]